MKALTIRQPWAHLIAIGQKRVENRPWSTSHRGVIGIHAGLSTADLKPRERLAEMAFGAIVATAVLMACRHVHEVIRFKPDHPLFWMVRHRYMSGPWCWVLAEVQQIPPIPCRGAQRLWTMPDDIAVRALEAANVQTYGDK